MPESLPQPGDHTPAPLKPNHIAVILFLVVSAALGALLSLLFTILIVFHGEGLRPRWLQLFGTIVVLFLTTGFFYSLLRRRFMTGTFRAPLEERMRMQAITLARSASPSWKIGMTAISAITLVLSIAVAAIWVNKGYNNPAERPWTVFFVLVMSCTGYCSCQSLIGVRSRRAQTTV